MRDGDGDPSPARARDWEPANSLRDRDRDRPPGGPTSTSTNSSSSSSAPTAAATASSAYPLTPRKRSFSGSAHASSSSSSHRAGNMQLPTPPSSQTSLASPSSPWSTPASTSTSTTSTSTSTLTRPVPSRAQLLDRSCSTLLMPAPSTAAAAGSSGSRTLTQTATRRSLSPQLERLRSSVSSTRELTPEPEPGLGAGAFNAHYFDRERSRSNSSGLSTSSRDASPLLPSDPPTTASSLSALRPSSAAGLNTKSPSASASASANTVAGAGAGGPKMDGSAISAYSMLSEYGHIAPAERYSRQAMTERHRAAATNFRPHGDLRSPERLNPMFFKYYSGREPPLGGAPNGIRRGRNGYFEPLGEGGGGGGRGEVVGGGGRILGSDHEEFDRYDGTRSRGSDEGSGSGGIPDYGLETHNDWAQRNGFEYSANGAVRPLLTSAHSSHTSSCPGTPHKPKLSSLLFEELDSTLRAYRTPLVHLSLLALIGLVLQYLFFRSSFLALPSALSPHSHSNFSSGGGPHPYAGTPDFPVLMNIEATFEKVVDSAIGGSELARSIKKSEMAIADLSITVKHSDLKCAAALGDRLARFATDCRDNIRGLSGFSSKVGGAMGSLLGINQWALRELSAISTSTTSPPPPSTFSTLLTYLPLPRFLLPASALPPTADSTSLAVSHIFASAVEVLESNLKTLVDQGEILLAAMNNLAVQHHAIYEEIIRESNDISHSRAEVMASLWSKLGGNAAQLKGFKANALLLRKIGSYEARARGYVEDTLIQLQQMTAELEELRQRVATPLLGGRGAASWAGAAAGGGAGGGAAAGAAVGIPIEVHMESLSRTVERLGRKQEERDRREGVWLKMMSEANERLGEGGFENEIVFDSSQGEVREIRGR